MNGEEMKDMSQRDLLVRTVTQIDHMSSKLDGLKKDFSEYKRDFEEHKGKMWGEVNSLRSFRDEHKDLPEIKALVRKNTTAIISSTVGVTWIGKLWGGLIAIAVLIITALEVWYHIFKG